MAAMQSLHDELNRRAEAWMKDPNGYIDEVAACRRAAQDVGLRRVRSSEQCEVWEDRSGHRVNLWIEDIHGVGLAPGGLGFDDQTEWAEG
jgi:hypothetical protein